MAHTIQGRPGVRFEGAREVRANCKRVSKTVFGVPKTSKLVLYKRVDDDGTWLHVLTGAKSCVTETIRVDTSIRDPLPMSLILGRLHHERHPGPKTLSKILQKE